jgi:CheY-like chemotaxis protein
MPTKNHAPIRALVVDDRRDSSESLARMLQLMGCPATWVTRAAKAEDAAEALRSREAGFDAYVRRPVDLDIVESMLPTVVASRR